jgi:GTP-binding protein
MIPVIALVGRPNVGKSTLFNRLTKSRDALVANYPGLTRDRKYGEAEFAGRRFMLIDTGGITGEEEGIDEAMASQSLQAIEEADAVLFVVDCRDGLTATDRQLATHLREQQRQVFLVANKIDGINPDVATAEFFELGYENLYPTTATHGRGVKHLMEAVLAPFPRNVDDEPDEADDSPRATKIAIIGRPNVGKSTLVNRMLGEDRVVVFDMPGTTRDSIYIDYERDGKPYTIIDTAGVRRRKNVKLSVEKFSIVKTLQAIDDANVVILLMDGQEGLVEQDMHLMGTIVEAGRALVLAVNKWDGLDSDKKEWMKVELNRRLRFVDFADVHFISALHGSGVGKLYGSIEKAFAAATDKLSTNHLTRILEDAVSDHQPPMVRGRRIKLRYAHAGGKNPPIIVIHGNQTEEVPSHYTRYLEKTFRKALDLHGTPVRIEYRTSDNPYAGRKNKLTPRQVAKKRRMMKHVKKKK